MRRIYRNMRCEHNIKQYAYVRANKLVRRGLEGSIKLSIGKYNICKESVLSQVESRSASVGKIETCGHGGDKEEETHIERAREDKGEVEYESKNKDCLKKSVG